MVNAYDGTLLSSYIESGGTSSQRFYKNGLLIDSSSNVYICYRNNNLKFELTKFSVATPPSITTAWGREIFNSAAGETYGTSLVFGADATEIFAGGYYRTNNNRAEASFFRITNTGTISWHYAYD